MSEKEKQILESLGKAIPAMSELEKERFLGFAEGMAFRVGGDAATNQMKKEEA